MPAPALATSFKELDSRIDEEHLKENFLSFVGLFAQLSEAAQCCLSTDLAMNAAFTLGMSLIRARVATNLGVSEEEASVLARETSRLLSIDERTMDEMFKRVKAAGADVKGFIVGDGRVIGDLSPEEAQVAAAPAVSVEKH